MNNCAFIQKTAELLVLTKENPIKIHCENSKVILIVNGESWIGDTLDQCIADMKQSFAVKYLDNLK